MHSPPAARQDLTAFKQRLQVVMKDNFIPYWDYLRRYVQAKLSKRELDQIARKLLGETNLYLHNIFIQAILSNSRSPHLPDVSPIIKPLTPKPRKFPTNPTRVKPPAINREKLPEKKPPIRKPRIIPVTVPLLGPEYNVLCARLQKIAIESGITQDAIQFMMLAIEVYIKQMFKNAKPLPRRHSKAIIQSLLTSQLLTAATNPPQPLTASNSSLPQPPTNSNSPPHPPTTFMVTTTTATTTLNDLYKTTLLHPSLLGEDFLLHQERLSLSLM